jgi:hypothetical protein
MIHLLGYLALILSLVSMTRKQVMQLRIISATGNACYVLYGILLDSPPLIIGGAIAVGIHLYHIAKLVKEKTRIKYEKE